MISFIRCCTISTYHQQPAFQSTRNCYTIISIATLIFVIIAVNSSKILYGIIKIRYRIIVKLQSLPQ